MKLAILQVTLTGSIKQDSGSKSLKCYSKLFYHMIKVITFRNNKKKDWFSHKSGLVLVHGEILEDGSKNSATFKMELFATTGNGEKLQRASSNL